MVRSSRCIILPLFIVLSITCAFALNKEDAEAASNIVKLFSNPHTREELCANLIHPEHAFFSPFICTNTTLGIGKKLHNHKSRTTLDLNPVILVPGLGGSGLEAQINKKMRPAWYCSKKSSGWYRIWFALEELFAKTCWLDNMFISYNNETGDYSNREGVNLRPIDFGGLDGITYLDIEFGHPIGATSVFAQIIDAFLDAGYTAGKNLHGAPFDWRVPATSNAKIGWYQNFQQLIEDTYTANGNKSVTIISHSMGGPTTLFFLNTMTQEWKDTYVKSFVPIASPWAGAPVALRGMVSGNNFGIAVRNYNLVTDLDLRGAVRQAGGIIELIPSTRIWNASQVVVTTNKRTYTMAQYGELFADMGSAATNVVYESVKGITSELEMPNVPTYCLFGHGIPTEIAYTYPDGDFDKHPVMDTSDLGDGTVPSFSLQQCTTWGSQQKQPVQHQQYEGLTHLSIIADPGVIKYLLSITAL